MAFAIRRKTSAALLAVATVGALGATAAPAGAEEQQPQAVDRWPVCATAPDGALTLDYDTGGNPDADSSVCWSGSGRATNEDDQHLLRQIHTANNRGSLHLKTGDREWDLSFEQNQSHGIPDNTRLLGLSINE
ncbi:hypothetical protein [Streptomyces sp. NL15-2K]|uniref:hypothetical protein n=1 Tax=Streptomyces sp. NL15-2K TaxID=376149 RepID=UPI000F580B2F|nr:MULTISPECIES: hypothetical protein [Actinomycetes]WKX08686.1 hypothetical protein Q4V64_14795 [Kutzneria buriramensis]GCB49830.1 hypothetical protein SNL152K_7173 [Streptomyces sp. NL15-2K]